MRPPRGEVSWEEIGKKADAPAPARALLRVPPLATVESWSRGVVRSPSLLAKDDAGCVHAVAHGLFDETAFGPAQRDARGGVDLLAYRERPTKRPQVRHFGAVRLASTVLNPWARRACLDEVASLCGVSPAEVEGVLDGRLGLARDGLAPVGADTSSFGADALESLAADRDARLPWLIRRVPLLPAGFRAPRKDERAVLTYPWFTALYVRLVEEEIAEQDTDPRDDPYESAAQSARIQSRLQGLFIDGRGGGLDGLIDIMRPTFGSECVSDLCRARDAEELLLLLRGELYIFHAFVRALCLEIVPLRSDGEIDEAELARWDCDRIVNHCDAAYAALFGQHGATVPISAPHEERPHVHVHTFGARTADEPPFLLTAGLSAAPLFATGFYVRGRELVCFVPPELDMATRTELTLSFLELGRAMAVGRAPSAGPLTRGSRLTHWIVAPFFQLDWTRLIHSRLLGDVQLEIAVGATAAEHLEYEAGPRTWPPHLATSAPFVLTDPHR